MSESQPAANGEPVVGENQAKPEEVMKRPPSRPVIIADLNVDPPESDGEDCVLDSVPHSVPRFDIFLIFSYPSYRFFAVP
ncbi:hypothetical protein BHM03_00030618 [Ensete ventricosum]|uniref:Uncharacterized protein n=1 Tax=Ensete ventricosum TaxID=4639 RepID=A0A427AAP3_ENSVE|nr:hypothetical protein B296_00033494 [Ensete ventricosum]RZS00840.1 hypothetical protein BHM03_00030618 [Ensete ventricosum]